MRFALVALAVAVSQLIPAARAADPPKPPNVLFCIADGQFPAGVALPVASARLKVGEFDATRPVGEGDKAVTFAVELSAGRTKLRTWFLDAGGEGIAGAYSVTVRRE
jgi:hypothetical protein